MPRFLETFTAAAGPHWVRTGVVTGTGAYGAWTLLEGAALRFRPDLLLPTYPKVVFTVLALAGLVIFWLWKYALKVELELQPALVVDEIKHRRHRESDTVSNQVFTLRIRNSGHKALSNCLVKVAGLEGDDNFTPRALRTYVQDSQERMGPFNLRGQETKEVMLGWAKVTKGDTFSRFILGFEMTTADFNPEDHPAIIVGLYSEVSPTIIELRFMRDQDGFLTLFEWKRPKAL